jgi:hypothetical protein
VSDYLPDSVGACFAILCVFVAKQNLHDGREDQKWNVCLEPSVLSICRSGTQGGLHLPFYPGWPFSSFAGDALPRWRKADSSDH